MFHELLTPVSEDQISFFRSLGGNRWGSLVEFTYDEELEAGAYDLAIIGIKEHRGSEHNEGCDEAPGFVRAELYKLYRGNANIRMVDLGDVIKGEQLTDTLFAVSTIVNELLSKKVLPILIGGSHDLTLAQYKAYMNMEKPVNMVVVDESIDALDIDGPISDTNHLMKLLTQDQEYLDGFTVLGYQSYFTDPEAINTLEKLHFECVRLGAIREEIKEVEPAVRDADMLSFDISAIRQSDAPGYWNATPNGFYAEEACQIVRYAGMSDRLSSFGIYGFNPLNDNGIQTAQLVAQMIWYFVEGYYIRKNDDPLGDPASCLKYIVDFNNGEYEMIFWKSKKSERWWLEAPGSDKLNPKAPRLIPCMYDDYQKACADEIPDRWLKAMEKVH